MSPQWTITKKLASQTRLVEEMAVVRNQNRVNYQAFHLDTHWLVAKNVEKSKRTSTPYLGHAAKDAAGLSSTSVVRLKAHWENDYKDWSKRDLSKKRYVYFWADGIYPRVRLEDSY